MRAIIAGSRNIESAMIQVVEAVNASGFTISEVISGTARGIDRAGEVWAKLNKVPCRHFPANWERNGKAAGYLRNQLMAEHADALIAIWDGVSKGTKHMIDIATAKGLKVYVHRLDRPLSKMDTVFMQLMTEATGCKFVDVTPEKEQ